MDAQAVIEATRRWIQEMVIGLNLCPFARRVFDEDGIRYVVSQATDEHALRQELAHELRLLGTMPVAKVETTLLIHPSVLAEFLDYNDFLADADRLLVELGLRGTLQIASFHPQYQFDESDADAAENYSNRSPFPMLHLLRESSISAVATDLDELAAIPERNIATLRGFGPTKLQQMLASIARPRFPPGG